MLAAVEEFRDRGARCGGLLLERPNSG